MKKVFSHWKTTSMGILSILGGLTRLIFAIKSGVFNEEVVMTCATTIVGGVGLILAADNTSDMNNPKIVKTNDDGENGGSGVEQPPKPKTP